MKKATSHELNDPQTNSCRALESLISVSRINWYHPQGREENCLQCIELLLDSGAKWNPPEKELTYARRGLGSQDAKYVVQVVRLLLYTAEAAEPAMIWKLCNSTKLSGLIKAVDFPLWDELRELRNAPISDTSTKTDTV
ncbi:MAG: hypothetical protein LBH01_09315 [Verrucomicrobiales bacterium]|nr:hypothetical protein [Verrucomicrobiales bacterium]